LYTIITQSYIHVIVSGLQHYVVLQYPSCSVANQGVMTGRQHSCLINQDIRRLWVSV